MNDLIVPVNNEAMSRALLAVVGETNSQAVVQAYQAIDSAMVFGYQKGLAEGDAMRKAAAEEYVAAIARAEYTAGETLADSVEAELDETFKNGYDEGYDEGYDASINDLAQATYDDGYIDGVQDARVWPRYADEQLERLCEGDAWSGSRG
jgi:hypothetical protein